MDRQNAVAVVGAGVVGAAIAARLAAEGKPVLLLDRTDPGVGGASFGNAGHIASEHVEPLPSRALLLTFWRDLYAFGGVLDIPLRRAATLLPWTRRFAAAAPKQAENTRHLAPLVAASVDDWERLLASVGRPELLSKSGHYEVWFGRGARQRAAERMTAIERLAVSAQPASAGWLRMIVGSQGPSAARRMNAAALWFPRTAHVLDPLEVVQALVRHALDRGAQLRRAEVRAIESHASGVRVHTGEATLNLGEVIVCAGAWSAELLAPLGLRVPLEGVRGYHVELPDHAPLCDSTIVYADDRLVVTPMRGRLRATSFMDFVGLEAPRETRKPARLLASLTRLGYRCAGARAPWAGPRPVLPDYLPAIGRVPNTAVLYAIGHQHIGLTLAAGTADLIAALVARREPRQDLSAFDLRRFA
jgi:D-hydroxyproline dehydrogenase